MAKKREHSWKTQLSLNEPLQKQWKKYTEVFGDDLNTVFGDDYDKKITLYLGLKHLLENQLYDAFLELRRPKSLCTTDEDKQIVERLITICLNEEEMAKAKVGDWVKRSYCGYYQVIKRTSEYAVIKNAFDNNLVYAKQSRKVDGFAIKITDLKTYQFVEGEELLEIEKFFADDPDEKASFLRNTDKMLSFRDTIIKSGFGVAEYDFRQFNFYRCTAEKTAFIVNLRDHGEYINVTYGFTSVANEDFLKKYGEDDDDIKLRFRSVIRNEQDETDIASAVKKVYDTYSDKTKDEILSLKKERQKRFLQKIADKLKPLAFKKKGAMWTRALEDDFYLEFYAQKSQWSDLYYFDITIYRKEMVYPTCFSTRLKTRGNWQLMTDEEFNCLLNDAVENVLMPIIKIPFIELGGRMSIWQGCTCKRDKCNTCWVQKNLWEANDEK